MTTEVHGTRHQWGPAPSGASQHTSVCRRCGLREVTEWYDAPDGAVEVIIWQTPSGGVVGIRRLDSHQGPPPQRRLARLGALDEAPPDAVVLRCPGHPRAWSGRSERLEP